MKKKKKLPGKTQEMDDGVEISVKKTQTLHLVAGIFYPNIKQTSRDVRECLTSCQNVFQVKRNLQNFNCATQPHSKIYPFVQLEHFHIQHQNSLEHSIQFSPCFPSLSVSRNCVSSFHFNLLARENVLAKTVTLCPLIFGKSQRVLIHSY